MDEKTIEANLTPYITAALRHILTGVAGALAVHGVSLSDSISSELIQLGTAGVLWGIGYAWSYFQKNSQKQAVITAAKTGVAEGVTVK